MNMKIMMTPEYENEKRNLTQTSYFCYCCKTKITASGDMSHDMRFPTMWYLQPAKPQISLRIRAV